MLTREIEEKIQGLLDAMPPGRSLHESETAKAPVGITPSSDTPDVLASRPV
jgi:hypothetical protein